jgi:hypothetical protein
MSCRSHPIFEDLQNPKEIKGYHALGGLQAQKEPRQDWIFTGARTKPPPRSMPPSCPKY